VADLYPTKTRLALLAGIAANEVTGYPYYNSEQVEYHWDDRPGHNWRVTKRIEELMRQDPPWVEKGKARGDSPTSDFSVRLSGTGRKVLEANGG